MLREILNEYSHVSLNGCCTARELGNVRIPNIKYASCFTRKTTSVCRGNAPAIQAILPYVGENNIVRVTPDRHTGNDCVSSSEVKGLDRRLRVAVGVDKCVGYRKEVRRCISRRSVRSVINIACCISVRGSNPCICNRALRLRNTGGEKSD